MSETDYAAPDGARFRQLVGTYKPVAGRWSGDAYCYHPHGVIRRGIIFTDHHHVSGHVTAHVILDPEGGIFPADSGRSASVSGDSARAVPRPKRGGLVSVYNDGKWVGPDGPWRKIVCEVLDELDGEIKALEQEEYEKQVVLADQRRAAKDAEYEVARAALARVQ